MSLFPTPSGAVRAARFFRHRSAALLLLAATVFSTGCDDESPTGNEDGGSEGEIQGTVARQKTGQGVEGVTLAVLQAGTPVAAVTSGPDGTFAISGLGAGTWEVVPVGLELAGLDPLYDVMEPARNTVVVADGESTPLVFAVVGLVPGRISGTVTCGGESNLAATVRVAGGTGTDRTVTPDAIGRYAALELAAGVYAVVAESPDCTLAPSLRIVEVRPGEFVRADFQG